MRAGKKGLRMCTKCVQKHIEAAFHGASPSSVLQSELQLKEVGYIIWMKRCHSQSSKKVLTFVTSQRFQDGSLLSLFF